MEHQGPERKWVAHWQQVAMPTLPAQGKSRRIESPSHFSLVVYIAQAILAT